jgi:hypothetical protein
LRPVTQKNACYDHLDTHKMCFRALDNGLILSILLMDKTITRI